MSQNLHSIVDIFQQFQIHMNDEQKIRESIKEITKELDVKTKQMATNLQIIHHDLSDVTGACFRTRCLLQDCYSLYRKLAEIVPAGKYYRYCDQWHFVTQRIVYFVVLTIFLEVGVLVTRETTAQMLGLKCNQSDGFPLDIEDYLMGVLNAPSELIRFATNAVTMGDYSLAPKVSRFVCDLSTGFRLLNLKNDGLRKRFDGLKYDVKKIEEVVYDLSIRGLIPKESMEKVAGTDGNASGPVVAAADAVPAAAPNADETVSVAAGDDPSSEVSGVQPEKPIV